jgi:CHAT domain-containing protein
MQAWAELVAAVGPGEPDWPAPRQEDLARAGQTRKILDAAPVDPEHMCYVAGWAPETPSRVAVGEKGIQFFATPRGDGQVTWATGIPAELRDTRTWYMNVAHGDLAAHEPGFPALHDLLVHGRTDRLSRTPPATWSRDGTDEVPLREETVTTFPSEEELTRAVMAMGAQEAQAPEAALRVSVCHGDVGYANHHVFVGHYTEDTIVSAERALDIWLEGELSVRHLSGLYPGPIGTAAVVFNRPGRPLKGGAVMGLGGVGTLSTGGLEKTMTVGILKLAAILRDRARERGEAPPPTFGISPVLLGTGEGGISLNAALRAILDAAAEANAMLSRAPWEGQIRLAEIQFMELYLDRAIEAADTLARISADTPGTLILAGELSERRGGRLRAYAAEEDRWSWRLQIQGDQEPGRGVEGSGDSGESSENGDAMTSLRFTVPTIRAAAGSSRLPADRRLVDGLLDEATTSTRADPELSETLFELLIPNEVKDQAPEKRDLLLLVDEGAARYPWELLKDPSVAGDPVAVESQMIRQLVTDQARRQINAASGSRVLVVGDPVKTHLPQLAGAAAEAEDVVKLFGETSYDVREIIHGTHSEIVRALFSSRRDRDLGYRIIHIAAHGEYQAEGSGQSGVVIGDHLYLTPHTFNQLRSVPELVFLNCCHLGRMDERAGPWRPNRIAANLGTQLIRIGVKAVVVAGWAVNDSAARTFSREFYGRMLRGETFGNAVLKARAKTWRTHSESNTWGAYQCYGDPQFTLPGEGVKAAGWRPVFRHPSMAVMELRNLMSRARTLRLNSTDALHDDVERIIEAIPPGWRDRSDVTEALGLALGELGRLEEALVELRRAVRTSRPQASVASQEKWGNYRARLAASTWLETDRDLEDAPLREARRKERLAEVDGAITHIDSMMTVFGRTTERLNLMGSAHKRRAMIVVPQERTAALTAAQGWYRRAVRHALEESGGEDYLGLINSLALYGARHSRGRGGARDRSIFQREYAAAKALVAETGEELHPYFGTSAPAELQLVRSIVAGTLEREAEAIGDGYEAAFRRSGSIRELASTVDQLTFFIEMLRVDTDEAAGMRVNNRAVRERLVSALTALRERVNGLRSSS